MKKREILIRVVVICFMLSVALFPASSFAAPIKEDEQTAYQTTYFMSIHEKGIYRNGTLIQEDAACLEENGTIMVPVVSLFSSAGFGVTEAEGREEVQVDFNGHLFWVNGAEDTIGFDTESYPALVSPVFQSGECFVSFQDLSGFLKYDAVNGLISMSVGRNLAEKMEAYCREMQQREVYLFPANESTVYQGKEPVELHERTYIQNGHMMIPLRDTLEALCPNTVVQWDGKRKQIQMTRKDQQITLDTVNQTIDIQGETKKEKWELAQRVEIINQRCFLSLRDFVNLAGGKDMDIYWMETEKAASIRL